MTEMMRIRVAPDGRTFCRQEGVPFFYLGDTAWELFHRLSFAEAELYLENRARLGFNVIQAVALAELDGLRTPNANGDIPFEGLDVNRPVEAYWAHIDRVIARANALGLVVGLLPTWGDKWNPAPGQGRAFFHPGNARAYGRWLGERYRKAAVIWILGGDRLVKQEAHLLTIREMAAGLAEGDGGTHLRGFHPPGGYSSSDLVGGESWCDYHQFQSGHCTASINNYWFAEREWGRHPVKPFIDGEPCYENHPMMTPQWKPVSPGLRYTDFHVRRAAYWSVFSGACGHTYGAQPLWMMWDRHRPAIHEVALTWREGLDLPGAAQMRHVKELLLGLPYSGRVPAPEAVPPAEEGSLSRMVATRGGGRDDPFLLVYSPEPQDAEIVLGQVGQGAWVGWWVDPKTGLKSEWMRGGAKLQVKVRSGDWPEGWEDGCLLFQRAA
ncbi:MAG: glycoside hydrolase family 140 protein [Candidatus Methylacidiphilales bacterium]